MSSETGAGKGDTNRPFDGAIFRDNYDNIFKKPKAIPDGSDDDFDSHDEATYDEVPLKFY